MSTAYPLFTIAILVGIFYALSAAFAGLGLVSKIRSYVYPNQKIEVSKDSPYGNIVITRRENLWSVYNNNTLLFDSENFMMNEEAVELNSTIFSTLKKVFQNAIIIPGEKLSRCFTVSNSLYGSVISKENTG